MEKKPLKTHALYPNYPYPKYSAKIDQTVYNIYPLTLNSGTFKINGLILTLIFLSQKSITQNSLNRTAVPLPKKIQILKAQKKSEIRPHNMTAK
jgi:hypothetical protein